jgi:hypothetical protein
MAHYLEARYPQVARRRLIAFVASSVPSAALDRLLDAGDYDVVLIDSMGDAYRQIKEMMPHLIIVCMRPEEEATGCQVLSMLGIDRETSHLPVLTHLVELDREAKAGAAREAARFDRRPASLSIN